MAEIRNYTMKFGYGRPAGLTFAALTLACAEIHCDPAGKTGTKEI
ncbi:MAG: hypothetical protein Q7J36_08165 [Thiobacillus sp.]|jgi:hypothetical protein|nr:hypothetical protein [Thiobacillus sp.]